MLLTLQFPISDSRPFVDFETGMLGRPAWPSPSEGSDFIRAFGKIKRRWNGGLSGWIGEDMICNAARALRFESIPRLNLPNMQYPITTRLAFRRFYADGIVSAMAKYEVGFAITRDPVVQHPEQPVTRQFFEHFLRLPVSVPSPQGSPVHCELWQAGKYLAALYLASSSTTQSGKSDALPPWIVSAGNPVVLVEYGGSERARVLFSARTVTLTQYPGALVSYHTLPMKGLNLRLWMLNNASMPREDARRLRIALLRLHAEKECLGRILTNLSCGHIQIAPRGVASDRLQYYFNDATKHLLSLQRRSSAAHQEEDQGEDDPMVDVAQWAEDSITPGERDSIKRALKTIQMRPNIQRKVEGFVGTADTSLEAANMERAGLNQTTRCNIVEIFANDAGTSPGDPEDYFRNLVRNMTLSQKLKNDIIGGWKGNTNYDADRLVGWALNAPLIANKKPAIIDLITVACPRLGGNGRNVFDGIIAAFEHATAPPRPGTDES